MLKEIAGAGWYLLELINKILDLAAIESGRLAVSQEPMCMADVMVRMPDHESNHRHRSAAST